MIQPLLAHFLAGAGPHGLVHEITGLVGIQRIQPHQNHVLILGAELGLTIDRPREIPVLCAVLYRHDAAGRNLTCARITLADGHDLLDDLFVRGGNGSTHPVGGFGIRAEGVRVAILAMLGLGSNVLPQIPGLTAAHTDAGQIRSSVLITVAGGISAAAVGDEDQIVLHQVNVLCFAITDKIQTAGDLLAVFLLDHDVLHIHAVFNLHAMAFQVLDQGQDHTLILVILGEAQCGEIRQTVDVMAIAAKVALHLQCRGPALEGEHGLPVQPEISLPEGGRQHLRDFLILKILFRRDEELGQRQSGFLVQCEQLVRMSILSALLGCTAQRVVGIMLVQPIVLIQHRDTGRFDGGHITE